MTGTGAFAPMVVVSVGDIANVPGPGAYMGVCFFPVVVAGTACARDASVASAELPLGITV